METHLARPNVNAAELIDATFSPFHGLLEGHGTELEPVEVGTVMSVGRGIAVVQGIPRVRSEELLRFPGRRLGQAFNLDRDAIGVILFDDAEGLKAGDEVRRTGQVLSVPVGDETIGRVIDPLGRPLDGLGPIRTTDRRECEQDAPAIMDRLPVRVPIQTGLKIVDALLPIGRGQRELILGDRQTGKTAIALDTILNQRDSGVLSIYCAVGQRNTSVANLVADLRRHDALKNCIVVVGGCDSPPGLQFVAPFAATSIGEYFMLQGRDVLIVYDDLTAHARSYRELSLLLRRPPGREAFPGDIFYLHSRLLERATRLRDELGGGSLTALPIAETEAQNVSAYIPTNLISITDGQISLSPDLFQKGILPAVDVGRSVSRVGGKTQLPAYRSVAGDLRLAYSQFEELEVFSRFSSRLDEETRQTLERGRRVREVFKQTQFQPLSVPEQIAVLLAVTSGVLDAVPIDRIPHVERTIRATVMERLPALCERISAGNKLSPEDRDELLATAREVVLASRKEASDA